MNNQELIKAFIDRLDSFRAYREKEDVAYLRDIEYELKRLLEDHTIVPNDDLKDLIDIAIWRDREELIARCQGLLSAIGSNEE